jgi:hypothetical protein
MKKKIKRNHKKQIEKILNGLQCPKDFACYTSGQERLCKAEDIGLESFLVCLERDPMECIFSIAYGSTHFCQCPLRVYIAKKQLKL